MERENYFDVLKLRSDSKDKDIQEAIVNKRNEIKAKQNAGKLTPAEIQEENARLAQIESWAKDKDAVKQERTEFIAKQSDAVREYFRLLDNHYEAYKREVDSWVNKYRLSDKEIEKLMKEDPDHTIIQVKAKGLPSNFIIQSKQFETYTDTIKQINESKVINSVYPWAKDVHDLYDFLAEIMGTKRDAAKNSDTSTLSNIISKNKDTMISKVGGGSGNDSAPFRNVFGQLQTVFDTKKPEERTKYDNSLIYYSLSDVFKSIRENPLEIRKDDKFVENILKKIKTKFDDDDLALAIYNKEAGLLNDPYEPPKVVISVRCSNCGSITTFNTREQAMKGKCQVCQTPFYSSCPSCHELIPTSANICPHCNTNLAELRKSTTYFNKAKSALNRGDYIEANSYIEQADTADPKRIELKKCPDFDAVKQKIAAHYEEFKKYLTNLSSYITAKQFVHALEEATKVKTKNPEIDISSQMKTINQALDKAKSMMPRRGDNSENAVRNCYDILDIVSDYRPAMEFIQTVPVQSVTSLSAVLLKGEKFGVTISYNPSQSLRVSYYLVRNENHPPKSYSDGTLLLKDSDKVSYDDYSALSGKKYYYAVFASREGILSRPAVTEISSYIDVKKLESNVQGQKCSLSFELPLNSIGARIIRKENGIPQSERDGQILKEDSKGAYDDEKLTYGKQYGYLVQTCYLENNRKIFSKGVGIIIKVEKDPSDFTDVSFKKAGSVIQVSYKNKDAVSNNALRVYTIKPELVEKRLHALLSIQEINSLLAKEKLLGSARSTSSDFTFSVMGNYSYDVVLVSSTDTKGRFVGLGKISSIDPVVVDLKKSEIKEGNTAYIRFKTLPPMLFGIHYLVVEADGKKKVITPENIVRHESGFIPYKDYKMEGLLAIHSRLVANGKFGLVTMGEFVIEGKHVYSDSTYQVISSQGPRKIEYCFQWTKKGFFKKKYTCTLLIKSNGEVPPFVVMMKEGSAPISATDINAENLLEINSPEELTSLSPNEYTATLPATIPFAPGMTLRVFLKEKQEGVKLVCSDYSTVDCPK